MILLALATVVLIVIFTEGHRRIPVQYARTAFRGGKMYRQAGSTYIPLRVNMAGMIPLIFAMSLMIFPGTIASYFAAPAGTGTQFRQYYHGMVQSQHTAADRAILLGVVFPAGRRLHLLLYHGYISSRWTWRVPCRGRADLSRACGRASPPRTI